MKAKYFCVIEVLKITWIVWDLVNGTGLKANAGHMTGDQASLLD